MRFLVGLTIGISGFISGVLAACAVPITLDSKTSFPYGWSGHTELVSYANGSVWIGDIKNEIYSEPFLVSTTTPSNPPNHIIDQNFTSYHGSPYPIYYYIFPQSSDPVEFTVDVPGSGAHGTPFPAGGSDYGFNIGDDGYILYDNENKFIGCQTPDEAALNTWKIYWAYAGTPTYPVGLSCTGPLYLRLGICGCNGF